MLKRLVRTYSSASRRQDLWLTSDATKKVVWASFSPSPVAVPIGSFPINLRAEFEPGFTTPPDPFEPLDLVRRPDLFTQDSRFWPRAAGALKQHIHECPIFSSMAAVTTGTPFLHIYDLRAPPPLGRIPEVEDILGTVEIGINGEGIKPETFEANMMYRPVTRNGATVVSDEMVARIRSAVELP